MGLHVVTSSDSGSFVVDHLAANGSMKHHWSQKVYWAITEGALASALLYAGGNNALRALQAASIFVGLPFDALLCMLTVCLLRNLSEQEAQEKAKKEGLPSSSTARKGFVMPVFSGVFDIFEVALSLGSIPESRSTYRMPGASTWANFFIALVIPCIPLYKATTDIYGKPNLSLVISHSVLLYTALGLFISSISVAGINAFALLSYVSSASVLTVIRTTARQTYGLYGNIAEDFCASLFLMPQVVAQLAFQVNNQKHIEDNEPDMDDVKGVERSDNEAPTLA